MGSGKGKKRSAYYTDDGWHCDRCLGTQTSLRRNGPNGQRMCTACYSKMQREKKKGESGYCERPQGQELETDSQLSVRGARPASAAARKFIEEFARNKGACESASARQDGSTRRELEMDAQGNTGVPAYGAALLFSSSRGVSEGVFSKTQTGNGEAMRASRNESPEGPYPQAAAWPDSSLYSQGHHHDQEDPNVVQGAEDLIYLHQQESSPHENISDAKPCMAFNCAPGNLAGKAAPMTNGEARMALLVSAGDEPSHMPPPMAPCAMNQCTDHLTAGGALRERTRALVHIPMFDTCSAPSTLTALGVSRQSGCIWDGSAASSRAADALQGRQHSDPCIQPFQS